MIEIPFVDQNDFITEAALEDVTYFLRFSWNTEGQFWVMGIQDSQRGSLLQGVLLVPNVALLPQFRAWDVPPGEFVAYMDNDFGQIDRYSFLNGQATLWYLTEAEYAAL